MSPLSAGKVIVTAYIDELEYAISHSIKGYRHHGQFIWEQKASEYYTAELKQTINDLPDGKYTLKAWVKNVIGSWTEIMLPNRISVTDGQYEIGLYSDSPANKWIQIDDVSLVKDCDNYIASEQLPKETTPSVNIDYTEEKLTNFDNGNYSINGRTASVDSDGTLAINADWYGNTVSIVKKGDSILTSNSDAQKLEIKARPMMPDVIVTQPSTPDDTGKDEYCIDR